MVVKKQLQSYWQKIQTTTESFGLKSKTSRLARTPRAVLRKARNALASLVEKVDRDQDARPELVKRKLRYEMPRVSKRLATRGVKLTSDKLKEFNDLYVSVIRDHSKRKK